MARKNRWKMYATSLAAMTLLAACGGATDDGAEAPDSSVTTDGTAGGETLNVQIDVEVASMDPQIATDGASLEVLSNTIDGLYRTDTDGSIVPALAKETEVSEDGLTYTFKLQEDAVWTNGEKVTANDFVYAWQKLVNPETGSEYSYIMGVAGVENADEITAGTKELDDLGVVALDDTTLEVTLSHPVPFFESLMTFPPFYPMNEKFMDEVGENYGSSADTLVANGAFKVTSYEPATTKIELEKNDTYYDADSITLGGLTYQIIKDSQQAMLSYQNGDLDVVVLAGEQVDLFKDDPEFSNIQAGYLWYVSPNTRVPALDNTNLRKAIGMSMDKQTVADTALKDGSIPADFIVPQTLATGPDGKDFRETGGTFLEYNPEEAKKHFEEAKEELGDDEFTFSLIVEDTESSINVSQMLKSQIEENLEGVTIEIEQMPKKTRLERMQNGDYELGLTRWGPDYADPMTYLELWLEGNSYNTGDWKMDEYNEIIESAQSGDLVLDKEARWEALHEAEALLLGDAAVLPLYQKGSAVMTKDNISGVDFHAVGIPRILKYATKE